MSAQKDYTEQEWTLLKDAITASGLLVIFTSPQGPLGVMQEMSAYYQAAARMLAHGSAYALLDDLRQDLIVNESFVKSQEKRENLENFEQVRKATLERCRLFTQLLYVKADEAESQYLRRGLLWACRQAALAVREGGGLFHKEAPALTEEERQTLRQVGFALGLPADQADQAELPEAPRRALPRLVEGLFTAEEWQVLRLAPIWVGAAITAAAPSGPLGVLHEVGALTQALQQARQEHPANRLIGALLDDLALLSDVGGRPLPLALDAAAQQAGLPSVEGPVTAEQAAHMAVETCRSAARLLQQKVAASEADQFKRLLLTLAQQVAESAREGGFLGIGARRITPAEQAVLDDIAQALA